MDFPGRYLSVDEVNTAIEQLNEIPGEYKVTACLLGCLDEPDARVAVLAWVMEFLRRQRVCSLSTIEYSKQVGGFESTIMAMLKKIEKIDALVAKLEEVED